MAALGFWGVTAGVFAVLFGWSMGRWIGFAVQRKKMASDALLHDKSERLSMWFQTVASPLRPISRKLMHIRLVNDGATSAAQFLAEGLSVKDGRQQDGHFDVAKEDLVSILLLISTLTGVIAGLLMSSFVCGIAVSCLAVVLGFSYVNARTEKRNLEIREEIPDALRSMSTCFRSGFSLMQTLQQTSEECKGALGRIFSVAARRIQMGDSPTEALSVMRGSKSVPELAFVAVALDVQHQSGGSIAPVLESARESVDCELDLMRSLRVQTAQAKLSASIVTVMPFLLVALFSFMSPDFLAPFFKNILGMALLALAFAMQLGGVLIVRRMLRIDAG